MVILLVLQQYYFSQVRFISTDFLSGCVFHCTVYRDQYIFESKADSRFSFFLQCFACLIKLLCKYEPKY